MSNIISLPHRHHIGTAAEIAGITGVCGDTAYETDTHIYKHWNGLAWVVGGKPFYVPRSLTVPDFTQADLIMDGAYHVDGLDLSAIVPAGVVSIVVQLIIIDDAANQKIELRTNATTCNLNRVGAITQVSNLRTERIGLLLVDSDRLIDYLATANTTTISMFISGYYIQGVILC